MDPLVWIAVGLGVGSAASRVARGSDGLFGDLLFGFLGAFLGGWLTAFLCAGGLTASAPAALAGAALFVLVLRLVHHATAASAP